MGTRIEEITPAIAIHPGEMILDEIRANGMIQSTFAKQIGMERSQLNEIIKGKRDVNAELATLLEASLDLPAQYWMNLQSQYNLDKVMVEEVTKERVVAINCMIEITEYISVKYFRKLKVLEGDPVEDVPKIYDIYGVSNNKELIDCYNSPQYARFRKSEKLNVDKTNLIGWVKYSEYVARSKSVQPFLEDSWNSLKKELRNIIYKNEDVHAQTQKILSEFGIKILYQDKAEKAPIDGIAFWSGDNPAIAMTLRHKRLDNFAFTLFHELGHVFLHLLKDKSKKIFDMSKNDKEFKSTIEEIEANNFASTNLIPSDKWEYFMKNEINDSTVYDFADEIQMNPSIILGRFCHETGQYKVSTSVKHTIN